MISFEEVYKVLKRIDNEVVFDYRLNIMFDNRELSLIKLLYEQNYIKNEINKETNLNKVVLTNTGKMAIIIVENKDNITKSKDALASLDYDISFIIEFILTRNPNKEINEILSLTDYQDYLEEKEEEIYNNIKIKRKNMPN